MIFLNNHHPLIQFKLHNPPCLSEPARFRTRPTEQGSYTLGHICIHAAQTESLGIQTHSSSRTSLHHERRAMGFHAGLAHYLPSFIYLRD